MKITTITTLELSSVCNLECSYCINRLLAKHPNRKPGIMSDLVFERCIELLDALIERGTQKELNLNGNGESLLDPQIANRIKKLRDIFGDELKLQFSTNGVLLNRAIGYKLKEAGIDRIDISPHKPEAVRHAVDVMKEVKIRGYVNNGPLINSHNWAGQLEPENCVRFLPAMQCDPLIDGRAYIQSEGDVVPWCYDYRSLGRIGHVTDSDILERELKPFALCKTCHQNQVAPQGNGSMIKECECKGN